MPVGVKGLHRSTARLLSRRREDPALLARLKQLASERPRLGYRRLTALLRREGTLVNAKKVYRLCIKAGLLVRPKRRKPRTRPSSRPEVPALERPNRLWSLDFALGCPGRWTQSADLDNRGGRWVNGPGRLQPGVPAHRGGHLSYVHWLGKLLGSWRRRVWPLELCASVH
ncbi:MAG: IS3 family transposase [Aphanocapsa lilacina HA4352-LM1]|nr:IS3 family transposase [Aphanocapsa lilacina HA4352-LM1]